MACHFQKDLKLFYYKNKIIFKPTFKLVFYLNWLNTTEEYNVVNKVTYSFQ